MGASSTVTDHGSTIMEALLLSKILVHLVILHGYPKTGNTIIFQALWSSRYTIAALLSFMVLVLIEWFTLVVQTRLLGFSEEQILSGTDLSKILFSLPPLIIVIVLAFVMQIRLHFCSRRAKNNKIV